MTWDVVPESLTPEAREQQASEETGDRWDETGRHMWARGEDGFEWHFEVETDWFCWLSLRRKSSGWSDSKIYN